MTIELPDIEAVEKLSPAELRLELACALYDRGRLTKTSGAELAGVDFFEFQRALGERGIASVTEEMFEADLAALKALFPK
jgi:predicted HTH domain antitoxin